jgi:hypothetical protein
MTAVRQIVANALDLDVAKPAVAVAKKPVTAKIAVAAKSAVSKPAATEKTRGGIAAATRRKKGGEIGDSLAAG